VRSRILVFAVLLIAFLVTVTTVGCGSKEQKTEIDIRARILAIEETEPAVLRVSELEAGRHWEFAITDASVIRDGKEALALADLALGNHLRIRANKSAADPKVYEAVYVDLLDSGEAAER
jgi:hypothetical protein